MQSGDFRVTYASDERIFETRLPIVALVGLLAALALVPLVAGTYWLDVLNRLGIAIIGFNVAEQSKLRQEFFHGVKLLGKNRELFEILQPRPVIRVSLFHVVLISGFKYQPYHF